MKRLWPDKHTIKLRMIALGVLPVLIVLPLLILAGQFMLNWHARELMNLVLQGNIAEANGYLDRLRKDVESTVRGMVTNERLLLAIDDRGKGTEATMALAAAAKSTGMDFLLIADARGVVLASDSGLNIGRKLPSSPLIKQARLGVTSSGINIFEVEALKSFSDKFPKMLKVNDSLLPLAYRVEDKGMLVFSAAHFPLDSKRPDAIVVAGVLINNNSSLIDHMNSLIHPASMLFDRAEGSAAIYLGSIIVAQSFEVSRPQQLGWTPPTQVIEKVLGAGEIWIGEVESDEGVIHAAYGPLRAIDGTLIGMVSTAIRGLPYRDTLISFVLVLMALSAVTLLLVSALFMRFGNQIATLLNGISRHMDQVMKGGAPAAAGEGALQGNPEPGPGFQQAAGKAGEGRAEGSRPGPGSFKRGFAKALAVQCQP